MLYVEGDPDRWCSHSAVGQELWQIVCHWVWNLRLALGHTLQGGEQRKIEWAPPKEATLVFVTSDPLPEAVWPVAEGRREGPSVGSVRICGL